MTVFSLHKNTTTNNDRLLEYRQRGGCVSHPGHCQKLENKVTNGYYFFNGFIKFKCVLQFHPDVYFCVHFRVRVERVTSTAALSQHLQHQVLSQQQDGAAIELQTLTSQGHKGIHTYWVDWNPLIV